MGILGTYRDRDGNTVTIEPHDPAGPIYVLTCAGFGEVECDERMGQRLLDGLGCVRSEGDRKPLAEWEVMRLFKSRKAEERRREGLSV